MKAIIFDLFGTLVFLQKETDPYLKAYQQYFSAHLAYPAFKRQALTQDHTSLSDFGKSYGIEEQSLRAFDQEVMKENESIRMFSEVEEVLTPLSQQYDLYVLSNIATPYIPGYDRLGLGRWIQKPYFSSKIGWMKPDPEIFEFVVQHIGLAKEEVMMVGDSYRADFQGASAYGLKAVWLNRGGRGEKGTITDLRQLEGLLA